MFYKSYSAPSKKHSKLYCQNKNATKVSQNNYVQSSQWQAGMKIV